MMAGTEGRMKGCLVHPETSMHYIANCSWQQGNQTAEVHELQSMWLPNVTVQLLVTAIHVL